MVFDEDSIATAPNKMSASKSRFVCVVSTSGHLTGIITDGDVRRWLTRAHTIDVSERVRSIANTSPVSAPVDAPREQILNLFSERIVMVPLVNAQNRHVGIAFPGRPELSIGNRSIGDGHPAFLIAEIGNNHQGDVGLARKLVDAAVNAGADCAKFQMRTMATLYRIGGERGAVEDLGFEYTLDLPSKYNLSSEQLASLFDYCLQKDIIPLCTPWDAESAEVLDRWGMGAFKVASTDLTNVPLLERTPPTFISPMPRAWTARIFKLGKATSISAHCAGISISGISIRWHPRPASSRKSGRAIRMTAMDSGTRWSGWKWPGCDGHEGGDGTRPACCAIIPARGGSKGIPRKNLCKVGGIPLIGRAVTAARAAHLVDRVFVSTEDDEIADAATRYGAEVIGRPPELATDTSSSESVILHALDHLASTQGYRPDLVVFLQCTSPFTHPQDVDRVIATLQASTADAAFTACPSHHFLWRIGADGSAIGVNHDPGSRPRRPDRAPEYMDNGAVYAFRRAGFEKARHRFFGRVVLVEMPTDRSPQIDEAIEIEVAKFRAG